MIRNGMRPVHAGEVLREDYLKPLGMSANALSWLNLQQMYDLKLAEREKADQIEAEIEPLALAA